MLRSLLGRIEEESTEERDPHAVAEDSQVGLGELKRCWILVHHLPHAVQEQREQRGLEQRSTGKDNEERRGDVVNVFMPDPGSLTSGKDLLSVVLLQVVASVQEAMAGHHPFLLHQSLKPEEAAIMRVQHQLHQGGNDTAQVSVVFFCRGTEIKRHWNL